MERKKIDLFRRRTFGEKLNATFDFVRENFRPLFKYMTYLLLPLALVVGFCMDSFMDSYLGILGQTVGEGVEAPVDAGYVLKMLAFVVGSMLMGIVAGSMVFSLLRLYNEREERLQGISFVDIRPELWRNVKRCLWQILGAIVVMTVFLLVMAALGVVSLYTLIITIPALLVSILPMMLWSPAYLLEDLSLWASLKKAMRLGFQTWGGIFGILLVIGILVNVFSTIVMLPFFIVSAFKELLFPAENGGSPVWMDFIVYLSSVLMMYSSMMLSSLSTIGLSYQYGHACDKIDGVSIDHDIDRFEQMSDRHVDTPETFNDFEKL